MKIKKFVNLFLSMALIWSIMAVSPVYASMGRISENLSASDDAEDNVLYSVRGYNAPDKLCQTLTEYGELINEDTHIEILSSSTGSDATALAVTNVDGDTMTKSLYVAVGENGELQNLAISSGSGVYTFRGDSDEEDLFGNESLVLKMVVSYNEYQSAALRSYFQPDTAMFLYYNDQNMHTVDRIYMNYFCSGYEYTYPDFIPLTDGWEPIQHDITVDVVSPDDRTYYHTSNPYATDRVIYPNGGIGVGHGIEWRVYVDGREVWDIWEVRTDNQ